MQLFLEGRSRGQGEAPAGRYQQAQELRSGKRPTGRSARETPGSWRVTNLEESFAVATEHGRGNMWQF